jgi:predicted acyltransferase
MPTAPSQWKNSQSLFRGGCDQPQFCQSWRVPTDPIKTSPKTIRITSIDALRGFVMFMMIFVNDLAGAPEKIVPDWMVHFSDRHRHGSGMTFVDLVFPAFLFIVGMSIPFALGSRTAKGEPVWKISGHLLVRTLSLLAIGILMVNYESAAEPGAGWSPHRWAYLMFSSAILAFGTISPRSVNVSMAKFWKIFSLCLRGIGIVGMIYCAFSFRGENGTRIITLSPFAINTGWYGILGLIAWAYLAAAIVFLIFRTHRTALLGCVVLMTCFFAADKHGFFENFWPARFVDFGGTLGSQAAITVAGLLLATILVTPETATVRARTRFTLLFIMGFAAAAMLVNGLYGISKNDATPSWCLWSAAITAALWLGFYFVSDVCPVKWMARPLSIAGQNVLLAYLLSEMLPSPFNWIHFGEPPGLTWFVFRSAAWASVLLSATAGLNRAGFRLKL